MLFLNNFIWGGVNDIKWTEWTHNSHTYLKHEIFEAGYEFTYGTDEKMKIFNKTSQSLL